MISMLTKHSFYLFSCITPYNYVFFRNKENERKNKQFGREKVHSCDLEQPWSGPQKTKIAVNHHGCDHEAKKTIFSESNLSEVTIKKDFAVVCEIKVSRKSQP